MGGLTRTQFTLWRDIVLLVVGASAFIFEVLSGGERQALIYGSLALMGIGVVGRATNGKDDK